MNIKYYRAPWTEEKVALLIKWWPHWGTEELAKQLVLTKRQVKAKADKLKLGMLSKIEALCLNCKQERQSLRRYGFNCKRCALDKRKRDRRNHIKPMKKWMGELLRTLKYRSKESCDLSINFLIKLWTQQKGKCFYSNLPLAEPVYGSGRNVYRASLDRVDSSKGYVKKNVVWSLWICNAGKSDFPVEKYLDLCEIVSKNKHNIQQKLCLAKS